MEYPVVRMRRLRKNNSMRKLIRNVHLSADNFVMPFFVCGGKKVRKAISSMPGVFQLSIDNLLKEVEETKKLGIPAVLLFGVTDHKDTGGTHSFIKEGIVQRAIRAIKKKIDRILVIADTCLCEYTSHGHCGILKERKTPYGRQEKFVDNDASLKVLAKIALSQAEAGADIVAPSAMMDGQIQAIREVLDKAGFLETVIMAYSAKYSSGFYDPFRDAADSVPKFGNRRAYQMDFLRAGEALREIDLDIKEGADIVMVKPALCYLDIIKEARDAFNVPLAAYNVSGEYAMVKAAALKGWIDEKRTVLEILAGIKRAGADIIITYSAKDVAKWIALG